MSGEMIAIVAVGVALAGVIRPRTTWPSFGSGGRRARGGDPHEFKRD